MTGEAPTLLNVCLMKLCDVSENMIVFVKIYIKTLERSHAEYKTIKSTTALQATIGTAWLMRTSHHEPSMSVPSQAPSTTNWTYAERRFVVPLILNAAHAVSKKWLATVTTLQKWFSDIERKKNEFKHTGVGWSCSRSKPSVRGGLSSNNNWDWLLATIYRTTRTGNTRWRHLRSWRHEI